ncbi:MAG: LemA family protein [Candidatus Schekmanbacteria bacterium]|nr:LemA family protein [Candidatus Schekmanbacteria bacterium]
MSWLPFIITAFAVVGIISYLIMIYNGLVRLKNNITKSWANIDVLLKQRHDELPKLIKVCEGQMKYEKQTLEQVIKARNMYQNAHTVGQKAQADGQLTNALTRLFAVAESYPDLKANQGFMQLQNRITALEESISDRREFYNESVNSFNIRIQQIPDVLIAGFLGFRSQEMFQVGEQDRQDVEVAFNFS